MSNPAGINVKTVLFATDLTENTARPLNCAVEVASSLSAKLILAHVLTPQEANVMEYASSELREQAEFARKELERISQSLLAAKHIQSEIVVRQGEIRDVIFEIRRQYSADLVIVGSSGERGGQRQALGSTAEAIFRSIPCSVIAIGPNVRSSNCMRQIESILFPVDFDSSSSMASISGAAALSRRLSADLLLLHASKHLTLGNRCDCKSSMEKAVQIAKEQWPRVEGLILEGPVPASIVSCAKDRRIGLIVMSVRPGDLEDGTRLHGVICDVIRVATCPVLSLVSGSLK
jgi:nucleotide-binding universal stress UspA family protein